MNERWDTPETSVTLRHVTKNGNEGDSQDCVAGIELGEHGMLHIDLRNLRPVRVLDRDNLTIEIYLKDVMVAVANRIEADVTR